MPKIIFLFFSFLVFVACSQPTARKPISVRSGSYIKQSVSFNEKIKQREETIIKEIIRKDSTNQYLNSGNGFWYYYTKKDSIPGPKPDFGDQINFDYNIKRLNGVNIYDENKFKNQNYRIDKEELFFGLREGLKLLQEGESATFIFPSYVAYGFYGDSEKIGHNVPIISEVTVISIFKN